MKQRRIFCRAVYSLLFFTAFLSGCAGEAAKEAAQKEYIAAIDEYTAQNYNQALKRVRTALRHDRRFYQARFLEAKILFFMERMAEAEKAFGKLCAKHKEYTEARIWYMRCLILSGQYEKAESHLEKELSYNPGDWRVYYLYALLGEKTDNYEKRLSMNRKAELALTDSAKVYMDLALVWKALGLESKAKEYAGKAGAVSAANLSLSRIEKALSQVIQE